MAITISGENNNDKILASDGVIDQISGINIVGLITASHINVGSNIQLGNAGIITATTFVGNVTGNVNSTSPLLLQTGGSERFRITGNNELGIAGANYGSSGQVLTSGGSGSAVTWTTIPTQVTISNNADNRVITGGSGTNLAAESSFTYNAGSLIVSNASGNVTQQLNATSGDAKIVLDNSGNGNYSAIDFERERSTGAGVNGGSIFMLSDTSSNDAYLYLQAQSASAQAPVTSALADDNGVRLILKGGDGIFSVETGSAERLRITNTGNLEKRGGGSYFAYNSSGYYAKQDNYDSTGGKSYWYDGGSGNNNIVASVDGQTGNLMSKGNLRILTTGKGIDFSTTSDAGGMSSEILDDYEEGTFSPGWFDDGGVFVSSYTVQYGQYTKIGNVVYFCFGLRIGTFSRTPNSGQACRVGNLPFVSREVGDDQEPVFNLYARLWGSGTPPETAWIRQSSGSGSNHVEFYMDESQTGNDHRLVGADFDTSSTCRVVVTGFYFTS